MKDHNDDLLHQSVHNTLLPYLLCHFCSDNKRIECKTSTGRLGMSFRSDRSRLGLFLCYLYVTDCCQWRRYNRPHYISHPALLCSWIAHHAFLMKTSKIGLAENVMLTLLQAEMTPFITEFKTSPFGVFAPSYLSIIYNVCHPIQKNRTKKLLKTCE